MSTATVSGRIPHHIDRLLKAQTAKQGGKRCQIVSRDITEKVLERAFPGIAFRDGAAGREAYLSGHRVAVWELKRAREQTGSDAKTAEHFGWPLALVKRGLAYADAFPAEIARCQQAETE